MSVENFIAVVVNGSFGKSKVSQSISDKEHEIGLVFLSLSSMYIILMCYNFILFSCVDNRHLSWDIFCYYAPNHCYHKRTI